MKVSFIHFPASYVGLASSRPYSYRGQYLQLRVVSKLFDRIYSEYDKLNEFYHTCKL